MYKIGAIPSPPDPRDYSVRTLMPVALPKTFKQHIGKNYDQEHGTCVAQTLRNIMREAYGIEFGTNFLYGGGRSHQMEGMIPAEAAKFLNTYGIAPYKNDRGEREVMDVIYYYRQNRVALEKVAAPFKGAIYGRAYTVNDIKSALYAGYGVAACFAISQWNPNSKGIWPCTQSTYGYHEMRVFGWDVINGTEYACVQNSWGSRWGKRGECFISWEDVLRVGDILVIQPVRDKEQEIQNGVEIRRTLRKGMRDEDGYTDVSQLQNWLNARHYDCGTADGIFGSKTRKAVKALQRDNALDDDGIVGPKTWRIIDGN